MEKVKVTRCYETEVFRAKDGKEFDSQKLCELYEKHLDTGKAVCIARELDREYSGSDLFYHTKDNRLQSNSGWFNAFLLGNGDRNQYTFANEFFKSLKTTIENATDEFFNGEYKTISDLIFCWNLEKLVFDEYSGAYKPAENAKGFSNIAKRRIYNILEAVWETEDYNQAVADMMSVLTGENWEKIGLRGCCQRDYMEFACNMDRMTQETIDAFKCELFGMGTEYEVFELHKAGDFPASEEKLENGYTTYIHDSYEPEEELRKCTGFDEDCIFIIPA